MRIEVIGFEKAHIIGRYHRDTAGNSNFAGTCDVFFFERSFGARQFKVITITEN